MQKFSRFVMLTFILFSLLNFTFAQVKIMAKPGELFDLSELGTIVLMKENKVLVEIVLPAEARHSDYRDIDIRKDDEILYVNGTKIKNTIELEKLYNETKIGNEIKLGIKRNKDLALIAFKKIDPESLPKRQMMKVSMKEGESNDGVQEIDINGKKYKAKDGKVIINGKEMTIEELMENKGDKVDEKE